MILKKLPVKSLPNAPIFFMKDRHKLFKCCVPGCGQAQRAERSKDKLVTAKCNDCLRDELERNDHGSILYRCALCGLKKAKREMTQIGQGDGVCY